MSRILIALLALVAGLIELAGFAGSAAAEKRVAFVVGTDKYDNLEKTKQLQRAVNDARAVGAAFKALGFAVVAAENLTRGQFNDQFQKFLDKVKAGDTAAIYYAGHGVEIEGLNFLLPRDIPDIKFGRQEQIKRESLSVAELLLDLRSHNPEIALVILDACRDNPLIPDEMRSAGTRGGGLAPLKGEPPKGTFIMYSAGAGESALDRLPGNDPDRVNSIFTRKLVPLLSTKGLALHEMARQLRTDVIALASTVPHSQRPAYYDGVDGKYCLAGCDAATTKRAEPSVSSQRLSEAAEAWGAAKDTTSVSVLETFITRYKETFYAELARARIEELKKQQVAAVKAEPEAKAAKRPGLLEKAVGLVLPLEKSEPVTRPTRQQQLSSRPTVPLSSAEEQALKPGDLFMECIECPEMVVLPAGEFMMGSPEGEEGRDEVEGPLRKVRVARPFAVGAFEVTFAEWSACVAAKGCTYQPDSRGPRRPASASWNDIVTQYLPWLSSKTGKSYRLLTEAEWEYAARAGTTTPFSTGRTITSEQANFDKGVNQNDLVDVGSFDANAFGLHDMHGNVYEWVQDCHLNTYVDAPLDGSAIMSGDCSWHTLRGGAYLSTPHSLRSASRFLSTSDDRDGYIGFRVARALNKP